MRVLHLAMRPSEYAGRSPPAVAQVPVAEGGALAAKHLDHRSTLFSQVQLKRSESGRRKAVAVFLGF